jgi:hypothetical protein
MFRLYAPAPDPYKTARFLDNLMRESAGSAARRLDSHVVVSDGPVSPMAATNCRAESGQR